MSPLKSVGGLYHAQFGQEKGRFIYTYNIMIIMALLGHSIFRVSSFDALKGFKVREIASPWQIRSFRQLACSGIAKADRRTWEN